MTGKRWANLNSGGVSTVGERLSVAKREGIFVDAAEGEADEAQTISPRKTEKSDPQEPDTEC